MGPGRSEPLTRPPAILHRNPKTTGCPAFIHCQAPTILSCLHYSCSDLFSNLISICRCFPLPLLTQTLPACTPIEDG